MQNSTDSFARHVHDFNLRIMLSDDLEQVLRIEQHTQLVPWSRLAFEESLSRDDDCRVLVSGNRIVAFYVISHVASETHILNLAVAPLFQGRGLGHMLLDAVVAAAERENSERIFLEVRSSNDTARSLYAKWQFRELSIRQNYYRAANRQREDAVVMVRERLKSA